MIKSESELIKELHVKGYKYKDVDDLFNQEELPEPVIKVILERFPDVYKEHRGTGDHLLRALITAKEPFDPEPLIEFFRQNIYNSSVMWGVAHVLSVSNTYDISKWLKDQLAKEHRTNERSGLVQGLLIKGGFKNDKELKDFLKKIYDKYPLQVLDIFKKIGSEEDIPFFQEKLKPIERSESKDLKKLIQHLNKKSSAKSQSKTKNHKVQ
jgi:hypothetical protein